ncbi:MAG TPA: hypothetical protein VFZ10_22135, partial [Geminicoccaceae bacterium]
ADRWLGHGAGHRGLVGLGFMERRLAEKCGAAAGLSSNAAAEARRSDQSGGSAAADEQLSQLAPAYRFHASLLLDRRHGSSRDLGRRTVARYHDAARQVVGSSR